MPSLIDQVLLDLLVRLLDKSFILASIDSLFVCLHVDRAITLKQVAYLFIDLLLFGFTPAWRLPVRLLVLGTVARLSLASMDIICSMGSVERA